MGLRVTLARAYRYRLRLLQGLAGDGAQRVGDTEPLNRPFAERVLRPAVGAAGAMVGRLWPRRLVAETSVRLLRAGMRGRAGDWLAAQALAALVFGGYALILLRHSRFGPVLALVAAGLGWNLPALHLRSRAQRRAATMRDDLPDAMDLLTVCVEAGLGFDQALARVVERFPGPVGEEFGRVLRDQSMGSPRRAAMLAVTERVALPQLRTFVHAVLQAEELGVRIGGVLRAQAEALRQERRRRAEEAAMKAPIKMTFPMIFLILPALFLVVLGPALIQGLRALQAAHR